MTRIRSSPCGPSEERRRTILQIGRLAALVFLRRPLFVEPVRVLLDAALSSQDHRRVRPSTVKSWATLKTRSIGRSATVPPTMYLPLTQQPGPPSSMSISVRAAGGSPALLTKSLAAALTGVNKDVAITFRMLSEQVNASLIQERIVAMLSGFFGGLALLLAGLGLYGVTSYAVSRRRTEIGIRMALGAAPSGVVRLVLRRVALLVSFGVMLGAGISVWASRFVTTLLYGLQPRDPATLVLAALVLSLIGAMAGWIPARRAARIDPAQVLREG